MAGKTKDITEETPKSFDFGAFSDIEVQEDGYDMPVLKPDKTPSGMIIRVAGPNSERRRKARNARLNRRIAKMGKIAVTAEQADDQVIEDAVIATIGWSFPEGFNGPECTPDNARNIYTKHNDILLQVIEACDDLRNFTKGSPKT